MNSLDFREVRANIISYLNSLPVPMELKRLIVTEVLNEIEKICEKEINEQLKAREESKPVESEKVKSSEKE